MTRTPARRMAPVLVALALALGVAGCGEDPAEETPTAAQSGNAELCSGYEELQSAVDDLKATPLDTTGTPEEVQAQLVALQEKALTVKAGLTKISALSTGPVAAAVGEMNQKADALSESLTQAAADKQEDLGPKVTAAQDELNEAYGEVTTQLDEACASS